MVLIVIHSFNSGVCDSILENYIGKMKILSKEIATRNFIVRGEIHSFAVYNSYVRIKPADDHYISTIY